MSNKWKIAIAVIIVLLGVSLYFNGQLFVKNRDQKKRIETLAMTTSNGETKIIERYIHDSIEHVVTKEVPVKSDAEKAIAVGHSYLDSVVQALKIATSQLTELTKVNARLTADIKLQNSTVYSVDTPDLSPVLKTYNDKYLALAYNPKNDSVSLNYNVSLNQAQYWKRSWFLAPKKYYLDFWSDDQRVNINGVKRFTTNFPEKPRRWGIGLSAGYGFIPTQNKAFPYIGASLNYNLIEF